jgi:hypothetical protein
MKNDHRRKSYIVDIDSLPASFPTHKHSDEFWEALGRAVATFGFLEETLGKAIFAFTATREYAADEIDEAYAKWVPTLQRTLSDALGSLISTYGTVVRQHGKDTIENLDSLLADLKSASVVRNVICHGSWQRPPDTNGFSVPFFVNREGQYFETPIDINFLNQTQRHVTELCCAIINTVTTMGWQFPGSNGPGAPIHESLRTG